VAGKPPLRRRGGCCPCICQKEREGQVDFTGVRVGMPAFINARHICEGQTALAAFARQMRLICGYAAWIG